MIPPSPGEPYNPLEVPNIALSLALEVLEQNMHPLPPAQAFEGAGIYLIYYTGPFDLYRPLVVDPPSLPRIPIYVGKGIRKGARIGISFSPAPTSAIYQRLAQHAASLSSATNLELADFRCKYLVVEDAFISLAESVLISVFRPLWNVVVSGFGNNPTGGPRSGQAQSSWDALHPGRERGKGPAKQSLEEIQSGVTAHFAADLAEHADSELRRITSRIEKYKLG